MRDLGTKVVKLFWDEEEIRVEVQTQGRSSEEQK